MEEWEIIAPEDGRIYFTVAVAGSVAWTAKKEWNEDKVPNGWEKLTAGTRQKNSRRVVLADFLIDD